MRVPMAFTVKDENFGHFMANSFHNFYNKFFTFNFFYDLSSKFIHFLRLPIFLPLYG